MNGDDGRRRPILEQFAFFCELLNGVYGDLFFHLCQ